MEQINLNIIPDGVMPVCHASQFDRDRTIRFNLTENGAAYTLAGTETIKCKIKKPDNTENVIDVTNTSSTYVEVVFGYDDLDVSGDAMCELVIIDGSDISGPRNFLLRIEADAYDGSVFEERSASGEIASFETNYIDNLNELIVNITATQAGSGTPSPSNPRAISGHSSCTVTVEDDIDDPQEVKTVTISLGDTYYGGTLNVTTGELTITHGYIEFDGTENWINLGGSNPFAFMLNTGIENRVNSPLPEQGIITNLFPLATQGTPTTNAIRWQINGPADRLFVYDYTHIGDTAGFKQMLSDNKLQMIYKLANPVEIQLTPTEVRTLLEDNNIFADTGDIEVKYLIEVI